MVVTLELRCPKYVQGIDVDPKPDWSLDDLISELNSIELKLNVFSLSHVSSTKRRSRDIPNTNGECRRLEPFVMHLSDDETDEVESEHEDIREVFAMHVHDDEMSDIASQDGNVNDQGLVSGRHFTCAELDASDDFEDESVQQIIETPLMDKTRVIESLLLELNHEHMLQVKEEIKNQIFGLETALLDESERYLAALLRVEKYIEARQETDRKLDKQYQREIAEALDNHITAVQRDREHRSQLEERRLRNDAAFEEAKRKEKAIQEERLRQERVRAEYQARLEAEKRRAEKAQEAVIESEKAAAKGATEEGSNTTTKVVAEAAQKETMAHKVDVGTKEPSKESGVNGPKKVHSSKHALDFEEGRLQRYKELDEQNQKLRLGSNKDFRSYELQIAMRIKQIRGNKENVRAKANDIIKIFNDPLCPQSISIATFAKKVVSQCERLSDNFNSTAFACGHVIVLVTSQVPLAMDILLAEFHRACIYTVPKHISYSKSAFKTREAYYKLIGYQEEDGKLESTDRYLERLGSYMKFYGALVQTEVGGVRNIHGIKEGWAWLARFLNTLPANIYTAVALEAFLKMAGFALFRKYKSQFRKILDIISGNFLVALKEQGDGKLSHVILGIANYIETEQFLQEPEGWSLHSSLLSGVLCPESDSGFYQEQYYQQSNRFSHNY